MIRKRHSPLSCFGMCSIMGGTFVDKQPEEMGRKDMQQNEMKCCCFRPLFVL